MNLKKHEKRLSIIMPFLNEGEEPLNTIKSIYDTANPEDFEIIAIQDDPAEPVFDVTPYPSVRFLRNPERRGAHPSQNIGAALAQSPNLLFIDAHMRFKKDNWLDEIVTALDKEPKTLYCTTCVGLGSMNGLDVEKSNAKYHGATLLFTNDYSDGSFVCKNGEKKVARQVLEGKWDPKYDPSKPSPSEIACVMGANYCIKKEWFDHLHGFNFLLFWGSSEPYLSLKTWLAGGSIKLLSHVEIGHIFRDRSPYATPSFHLVFNKLLMLYLFFSEDQREILQSYLPDNPVKKEAKHVLELNMNNLVKEKAYLQGIFTKRISDYYDYFKLYFPSEKNTP